MIEDLGPYGTLAWDHMARWLPATLAAIAEEDRAAYFRDLDERVAARIEALERFSMPPPALQASDPMGYLGRMNVARLMARDQAMGELVYLAISRGWRGRGTPETSGAADRSRRAARRVARPSPNRRGDSTVRCERHARRASVRSHTGA